MSIFMYQYHVKRSDENESCLWHMNKKKHCLQYTNKSKQYAHFQDLIRNGCKMTENKLELLFMTVNY
jgi:hypothetical protein